MPQALEGVAAVGILYAAVRRWFTPGAALLAGAVLAAHPGGGVDVPVQQPRRHARAVDDRRRLRRGPGRRGRRAPAGSCSPARWWAWPSWPRCSRRCWWCRPSPSSTWSPRPPRCAAACCSCSPAPGRWSAAAGWWLLAVSLWPASSRPYIGGSQGNSIWNLIFGYNGVGRLSGNETGSVGVGAAPAAGAPPASAGCSTPTSAGRSPGWSPRRSSPWWRCCGSRAGRPAPAAPAPRRCSGAGG